MSEPIDPIRLEYAAHRLRNRLEPTGTWHDDAVLVGQAANRLAKLEAIAEKLPLYEDTGERFVPLLDEAWTFKHGRTWVAKDYDFQVEGGKWRTRFFSTPEAAEAARREGE